jgi:hypothetical protein
VSYDLNFCRGKACTYSWEEFCDWACRRSSNFRREAPDQIWYQNDITGVYFCFEQQDEDWRVEVAESAELETVTKLTFNLNYLRPSFFGREAMPFVEEACRVFDLLTSNPQSDGVPYTPQAVELVADYLEHNRRSSAVLIENDIEPPHFLTRERSERFFEYGLAYPGFTDRYKDDYFVGKMVLCLKKSTKEVLTLATVSAGVFALVPKTDLIALTRERRHFFKEELEMTILPYEELRRHLGPNAEEGPEPNTFIISKAKVEAAQRIIEKLTFHKHQDFTGLRPDQVLDFVPGGDTSGVQKQMWDVDPRC